MDEMDERDEVAEYVDQILAYYRSLPKDPVPVTLSEEYLRRIRVVEGFSCNQSGQDKSWVQRLEEADNCYFANLKRPPGY
jgi:hypothetical protein